MDKKRTFTKEQQEQKNKKQYEWEAKKKEQFRVVMNKGTKERIKWVLMGGETVHGFMVQAVLNEVRKREELKQSGKILKEEPRQQEQPRQAEKPLESSTNKDLELLKTMGVKTGSEVFKEDEYIEETEYIKDPEAPTQEGFIFT